MIAAALLAVAPLLAPPPPPPAYAPARAVDEVHDRSDELLAEKRYEEAVLLLREHLLRAGDDAGAHERLGRALLALERADEAAHHLAVAVELLEGAGRDPDARDARRDLQRADPLNTRRGRLLRDLTARLHDAAERLFENGDPERALALLARALPLASGKDADELRALHGRVRATFEEVDLDSAAGADEGPGGTLLLDSEHYRFECDLERSVVDLVAETMDDVHRFYVQIFFAGDAKAAAGNEPAIRVHADRDSMATEWTGGDLPQGWWSPGQNRIVCYDTRTTYGSLDPLLETLYHETSHQFVSKITARRGGWAPAWINEGTACFFEGTVAMADHRVLWPEAAMGRLLSVSAQIGDPSEPSLLEVIGYGGRGSYPANFYPFGWGLVYFMQQYEDPATRAYAYRPLYAEYLERITTRGGESLALFQEVFLGARSPMGHADLDAFERDWEEWLQKVVRPMHVGPPEQRRELRLARARRYLEAAELAAGDRKAPVPEEELLLRALGDAEYVRTRIDGEARPDLEVHLMVADLLERLDRDRSAAPVIQVVLDLADDERLALDEEQYARLEGRLKRLDARNWALRAARSRQEALSRSARRLVQDYLEQDPPMPLRAYTLAAAVGAALDDREGLLPTADALREQVRAAGLLLGEVRRLGPRDGAWRTIYSAPARAFEAGGDRVRVRSVRPVAYVDATLVVGPEYELRATLAREGEVGFGSGHGVVLAATMDGDWVALVVGGRGDVVLKRLHVTGGGGIVPKNLASYSVEPPFGADEEVELAVHVYADRTFEARLGGREPIRGALPDELPRPRHVGVYVKDGALLLRDPVVELYP